MPGEEIDAAALGLRFVLAFVFLVAAIPKLFGRAAFERAVANYALVPSLLVAIVAAWLPRLELGLAFALFLGVAVVPVAAGAAVLLLLDRRPGVSRRSTRVYHVPVLNETIPVLGVRA